MFRVSKAKSLGMSYRDLEGDRPSVAIAKEICSVNLQVAEQRDSTIGRLLEEAGG